MTTEIASQRENYKKWLFQKTAMTFERVFLGKIRGTQGYPAFAWLMANAWPLLFIYLSIKLHPVKTRYPLWLEFPNIFENTRKSLIIPKFFFRNSYKYLVCIFLGPDKRVSRSAMWGLMADPNGRQRSFQKFSLKKLAKMQIFL